MTSKDLKVNVDAKDAVKKIGKLGNSVEELANATLRLSKAFAELQGNFEKLSDITINVNTVEVEERKWWQIWKLIKKL